MPHPHSGPYTGPNPSYHPCQRTALPSYHPSQAMEGEVPHRGDTPMVDVRDCAAAHIEVSE